MGQNKNKPMYQDIKKFFLKDATHWQTNWPFQNGVWLAISLPGHWTHNPGCSKPLQSWAESQWLSGNKPWMGLQWKTTGKEEKRKNGIGIVCRREDKGCKIKTNKRLRIKVRKNKKGRENKISDYSPLWQKVSLQHGLACAQVCRAKLHCFFLRCADPTNTHTYARILQLWQHSQQM